MDNNLENNELEENIEDVELIEEVEEIPEIDSKYRRILLAAQRSKQLQRGATPRVNVDVRKIKPTRIAMKELEEKKIHFKILEQE
jgi:DNA-directed RNA polymerase subunit omega